MNKGTVNGLTTKKVTDSFPTKQETMYSFTIPDLTWKVSNL